MIKLRSLFFFTGSVFACLLSLVLSDIRAGIVLEGKAGSNPELENAEAQINKTGHVDEASEVSVSCKAQKVHLDMAR